MKQRYPHLKLSGIDLSQRMVSRASLRACRLGTQIHFEVADAQVLPFPADVFDVVYSFGSAKHWPDPVKGFGECWRVLRTGGELLVADATSDATRQQMKNFIAIAGFPGVIKRPMAAMLMQRMFRPAKTVEAYRQIAAALQMPAGTVSHLPSMPAFVFRARKPPD